MSPEDREHVDDIRRFLQDQAHQVAQDVIERCRARGGLFALPAVLSEVCEEIKWAAHDFEEGDDGKAVLNLGRLNGLDMAGMALVTLLREYEARLN